MGRDKQLTAVARPSLAVSDGPARFDRRIGTLTIVLVIGYLVAGRTFAYIGLASANVYIGEVVLVALVVIRRTRTVFLDAITSITHGGPLSLASTMISALLGLGVLELARGLNTGYSVLYALRNLPFDYYPVFVLLGAWVAARNPDILVRVTWWLAIVNGVYGPLYVLVFSRFSYTVPGEANVPLFGTGTGSAMALLGLLAYHRKHRYVLLLAGLNVLALLGNQIRGEWLALIVGLGLWAVLAKQLRLLVQAGIAVVGGLSVLGLAHVNIGGAAGRGGTVSLGGVFGRLIAAVDPALAAKFTPNSSVYSDTVSWRTVWWHDIWVSSKSTPQLGILGHGYGFPLPSLTTYVPPDTRTPHNVFFYALAYSGWVGVILLLGFWLSLLLLLIRRGRLSGDWFGLIAFVMALVIGSFGDWFETPFGAVPSYLLVGLAIGPLLTKAAPGRPAGALAAAVHPHGTLPRRLRLEYAPPTWALD